MSETSHNARIEPEEVHHHNSWAPLIIAIGSPLVGLGILYPKSLLPVGIIVSLVGLMWWFREDIKRFREEPDEHHSYRGMHPIQLGMWFFIGSEVIIFGSLFAIWFVAQAQLGADFRPHDVHLPLDVALINTALLVSSGGALHWGMTRLKKEDQKGYIRGLGLSCLLGLAFVALQVQEYVTLVHEGFTIQSGIFGSAFYILTGTHGLHVAGGLFYLLMILGRSVGAGQTKNRHMAIEAGAMYWHFVDVVWIFLVIVVYMGALG